MKKSSLISKVNKRSLRSLNLPKDSIIKDNNILGSDDYLMKSGEYTDRYPEYSAINMQKVFSCGIKDCGYNDLWLINEHDKLKGNRISELCPKCHSITTLYVNKN